MDREVLLSVIVSVYNHECYIEQAIQSILMQKVNFNYEVLIGEDCSTDGTREILKKMEMNLPDYFQIFYRDVNLGAKRNHDDLAQRMRGDYFICLEGDDFWLDENKLQKQIDVLLNDKECIAVAHNVLVVDEYSRAKKWYYPECKKTVYTLKEFAKGILPGQWATIMATNYYKNLSFEYHIENESFPGDWEKAFLLAVNGKVVCIQEKLSAYRYVTTTGNSFSANTKFDDKYKKSMINFYKELCNYAIRTGKHHGIVTLCENMYLAYVLIFALDKNNICTIQEYFRELRKCSHKISSLAFAFEKFVWVCYDRFMHYMCER